MFREIKLMKKSLEKNKKILKEEKTSAYFIKCQPGYFFDYPLFLFLCLVKNIDALVFS